MKLVINDCWGGYSLSAKGTQMYYKLKGIECYFFKQVYGDTDNFIEITLEEAQNTYHTIYSTKNPFEDKFIDTYLTSHPEYRTDPDLVRVVETLGLEANGPCAELKIIEIPDNIQWEIHDYDGIESVREKHRSWS